MKDIDNDNVDSHNLLITHRVPKKFKLAFLLLVTVLSSIIGFVGFEILLSGFACASLYISSLIRRYIDISIPVISESVEVCMISLSLHPLAIIPSLIVAVVISSLPFIALVRVYQGVPLRGLI